MACDSISALATVRIPKNDILVLVRCRPRAMRVRSIDPFYVSGVTAAIIGTLSDVVVTMSTSRGQTVSSLYGLTYRCYRMDLITGYPISFLPVIPTGRQALV